MSGFIAPDSWTSKGLRMFDRFAELAKKPAEWGRLFYKAGVEMMLAGVCFLAGGLVCTIIALIDKSELILWTSNLVPPLLVIVLTPAAVCFGRIMYVIWFS